MIQLRTEMDTGRKDTIDEREYQLRAIGEDWRDLERYLLYGMHVDMPYGSYADELRHIERYYDDQTA